MNYSDPNNVPLGNTTPSYSGGSLPPPPPPNKTVMGAPTTGSAMDTTYPAVPGDTSAFKFNQNFNPDDPVAAFNNMLREQGYNPNAANPYMQYLRRMAPGMALSFNQGGAFGEYGDPLTVAQNPQAYHDYLAQYMNGGAGGMQARLNRAYQDIPALMRLYRQQSAGTQNLQNVNPFLYAMNNAMSANNGAGMEDVMGAYLGPAMNQTMRQAYQTGLGNAYNNAMYNYGNNATLGNDIWTYLLGI